MTKREGMIALRMGKQLISLRLRVGKAYRIGVVSSGGITTVYINDRKPKVLAND